MTSTHIAIVGSGLTGLLIAQGLRKNGVSARVFEQDVSVDQRPRDWTLMLHWGLESLEAIIPRDVLEKLAEAHCDPYYPDDYPPPLPVFHGGTGEVLFRIPSTRMRLVSRQRLRKVLSHGLDIEYGKELARIVDGANKPVVLEFKDQSRISADMIVGADGANSAVRVHLLGAERARPVRTPWAFSLVSCTFNDASKAQFVRAPHPVWHMSHGSGGVSGAAVANVKESNDPSQWEFSLMRAWHDELPASLDGDEALRRYKEKTAQECEPYRSASAWIPEGSRCHIDQLKYWAPEPWDSGACGRITLAGDAAHAILPYRAQGFNVSMEDSRQLIDCLVRIERGEDRQAVMDQYDKDVCERGRAAVLASLEEGKKKMNVDLLMTSKTATQGFAKPGPQIVKLGTSS